MVNLDTTITIRKTTKKKLSLYKVHKRETWDDLLNRLINMYKRYGKNEK